MAGRARNLPSMSERFPEPSSATRTSRASDDADEAFLLRMARTLSGARRASMFADLVSGAASLLDADIAVLGRCETVDGVRSLRMIACVVKGELVTPLCFPCDDSPCDPAPDGAFRFAADGARWRFPLGDGREHPVSGFAAMPLRAADGDVFGVFCILTTGPMTSRGRAEALLRVFAERAIAEIERNEAEDALRKSEERYRSIFDASVDGLALLTQDGVIVDVNPAIERMYGYSREEMTGQQAVSYTYGASRENAERFLRAVERGQVTTMVDKARHRDGSEFTIEPSGVPIEYRGKPHILTIIRDVTERTAAETARLQLEAQLRQAQKMEAIGHLAGGVAHDFNNILTSVLGYLELAREHSLTRADAALRRYLDRAQRSGARAREIIGQMLTFSRGQPGEARPIDVDTAILDAAALVRSMVPESLVIEAESEPDLPAVLHDPVQLEQVIVALCLNAADAMEQAGTVHAAARVVDVSDAVCTSCLQGVRGRFVEISVTDAGCGMSPALLERVFEPFFSTKDVGKGSGMGLSIVHGTTHRNGGHVVVRSAPNEGTTVRVLLPAAPGGESGRDGEDIDAARERARPRLRGRALVVDDDADVAGFVGELLEGWGLDVVTCPDAACAQRTLTADSEAVDVAVVNHALPDMSGLELIAATSGRRPRVPVILYGGPSDAVDEVQALAAGAAALVRKPFDTERFHDVLSRALGGR